MKAYEIIDTLFGHNLWSNLRLFELCAGLSDEQLDASISNTYGTIRDTLEHIALAERSYLSRVTTGQPYKRDADTSQLTLAEMLESVRFSGEGLIKAASQVQASDSVEVNWKGSPRAVPSAVILTQGIHHATEHRTQVMATLAHIGVKTPDIAAWTYFDMQDAGASVHPEDTD
jgi:uncharacterized damage-inducible protein DinB